MSITFLYIVTHGVKITMSKNYYTNFLLQLLLKCLIFNVHFLIYYF